MTNDDLSAETGKEANGMKTSLLSRCAAAIKRNVLVFVVLTSLFHILLACIESRDSGRADSLRLSV